MRVPNKTLLASQEAFNELKWQKGLGAKLAYSVARSFKNFAAAVELYHETRDGLAKELGIPDPKDPRVYAIPPERVPEFQARMKELDTVEAEVDCWPIPFDALDKLDLTPEVYSGLSWLNTGAPTEEISSLPKQYEHVELGKIITAGFAAHAPAFEGGRTRGVRRLGQIYEWKWQEHADQAFDYYIRSPWLVFRAQNAPYMQWCQPDGLLFLPDKLTIVIVECKLRHMPEAYWQVTNLYQPVLERIFQGRSWTFRKLEVVKWYDPSTYFPCEPTLVEDPLLCPRKGMGVHIWKK